MIIVGVCGPAGAGKDTFSDYLIKKYNFKRFSFTDVLINECGKRSINPTKENLSKLGDELRKEGGMDVLARKLWKDIQKNNGDRIVIPNFRSPQEVEYILGRATGSNKDTKFYLIMITAPPETRFSRLKTGETFDQFIERDRRDFNYKKMGEVFDMADFYVSNSGSFDELWALADDLINKILTS